MALSIPIASLEVLVGSRGMDRVAADARGLDRELGRTFNRPLNLDLRAPDFGAVGADIRRMRGEFASLDTEVRQVGRSMNALARAGLAPRQDLAAATTAQQRIQQANAARAYLAQLRAQQTAEQQVLRGHLGALRTLQGEAEGMRIAIAQARLSGTPPAVVRAMQQDLLDQRRAILAQRELRDEALGNLAGFRTRYEQEFARLAPVIEAGGTRARSALREALRGLDPAQFIGRITGALGGALGAGGGLAAGIGRALGGGGILGLPATGLGMAAGGLGSLTTVLAGLAPLTGGLTGVLALLTGGLAALTGVAGAAFGALGGGLRIVGNLARGVVDLGLGVGRAVAGFLQWTPVATVLTGGLNLLIDHFGLLARAIGLAGGALAGFIAQQIIAQGTTFEQAEANIRAVAAYSPGMYDRAMHRATPELEAQLRRLDPIILTIARDTQYNTQQVAEGIQLLLQGGVQIQQVTQAGATAIFDLAAATDSTIESTIKVADALMQIYRVPAEQIPMIADLLGGLVNTSLMTMTEVGTALRQVGPVARTLEIPVQDLTVALGLLSQAGFRGEIGGTALRNFLLYLQPRSEKAAAALEEAGISIEAVNEALGQAGVQRESFFDASGRLRPLREVYDLLGRATARMTDMERTRFFQTVFGTRSGSAANIGSRVTLEEWDALLARMSGVGVSEVRAERMNTVLGQFEILRGTIQNIFALAYRNWLQAPFLGWLRALNEPAARVQDWFGKAEAALGGLSRAQYFFQQVRVGLVTGDLGTAFVRGLSVLPDFIKNSYVASGAFRGLLRVLQLGRDAALTFGEAWQGAWRGAVTPGINPFVRLAGIVGNWWGAIWRTIGGLLTGRISFRDALDGLTDNFVRFVDELRGSLTVEGPRARQALSDAGSWLRDIGRDWWDNHLKPGLDYLGPRLADFFLGTENPLTHLREGGLLGNTADLLLGTGGQAGGGLFGNAIAAIRGQAPALQAAFMDAFGFLFRRRQQVGETPEFLVRAPRAEQDVQPNRPIFNQPPGLRDVFEMAFTELKAFLTGAVGPTLDTIRIEAEKWFLLHQPQIRDTIAAWTAFGLTGIAQAIRGLLGAREETERLQAFGEFIGLTMAQGIIVGFQHAFAGTPILGWMFGNLGPEWLSNFIRSAVDDAKKRAGLGPQVANPERDRPADQPERGAGGMAPLPTPTPRPANPLTPTGEPYAPGAIGGYRIPSTGDYGPVNPAQGAGDAQGRAGIVTTPAPPEILLGPGDSVVIDDSGVTVIRGGGGGPPAQAGVGGGGGGGLLTPQRLPLGGVARGLPEEGEGLPLTTIDLLAAISGNTNAISQDTRNMLIYLRPTVPLPSPVPPGFGDGNQELAAPILPVAARPQAGLTDAGGNPIGIGGPGGDRPIGAGAGEFGRVAAGGEVTPLLAQMVTLLQRIADQEPGDTVVNVPVAAALDMIGRQLNAALA